MTGKNFTDLEGSWSMIANVLMVKSDTSDLICGGDVKQCLEQKTL